RKIVLFKHKYFLNLAVKRLLDMCRLAHIMLIFVHLAFTLFLSLTALINIHIIPHSHNDYGWLKTPFEYYYGIDNHIQNAEVRLILDSVTMALIKNPERTFIYDVIGFFSIWFDSLNNETKLLFNKLLANSQFEFVNGGWVSNDEATADYLNIIDQLTDGLLYLKRTFKGLSRPFVGWQVDPFGHSLGMSSILSAMEFKALFFGRVSYDIKKALSKSKKLEMTWSTDNIVSYREISTIFTSILPNMYNYPDGLCFDYICNPVSLIDVHGYENYKPYVDILIQYAKNFSHHYKTQNIIATMGSDFTYQVADKWYDNLDVLIRNINKRSGYKAFYSTPWRYFESILKTGISLPEYKYDFFPYSTSEHSCWTGFYTSRPGFKRLVREKTELLRGCKQLASFDSSLDQNQVEILKRALDAAQHHDAITGTAKQRVSDDYAWQINIGSKSCQKIFNDFLTSKFKISNSLTFCDQIDIGMCHIGHLVEFYLVLYNQNSVPINFTITIPVTGALYIVYDSHNKIVPNLLSPKMEIKYIDQFYDTNPNILQFNAKIEPLSFTVYSIFASKTVSHKMPDSSFREFSRPLDDFYFENEYYVATFDLNNANFRVLGLKTSEGIKYIAFSQTFSQYISSTGDKKSNQSSGAYIFRPASNIPIPCLDKPTQEPCKVYTSENKDFSKIYCHFGDICRQELYFEKNSKVLRVHYAIGPLNDQIGTEVIIKWSTNISSQNIFYTDVNGRSKIKRNFNSKLAEFVAGNYYPVVKNIFINDSQIQFNVFTDRTLGGSSLSSGSIELMLNRRMFKDDDWGVNEALNETDKLTKQGYISVGNLWLMLSEPIKDDHIVTETAYILQRPPIISFSTKKEVLKFLPWSLNDYLLPPKIRLLSLERYITNGKSTFLVRFENIYSTNYKGENNESSFDMMKFLHPMVVTCVKEQVLSGDINIERGGKNNVNCCDCDKKLIVFMKPKQIRTFLITSNLTINSLT
ncbi:hypothetical protein HZS_1453, partial [Henneguya salminicola]